MKYCIFCGSQLDDEAIFCGSCGKRNVKEAENGVQDNDSEMHPQYINDMQGSSQSNGYGQMYPQGFVQPGNNVQGYVQPADIREKNGSRNKKKCIIVGIIVLVLALGVATVLIFRKSSGKNDPLKAALDNYFKAVENLDFRALDKACYPENSFIIEKLGLTYKYPDNDGPWISLALSNSPAFTVAQWVRSSDRVRDIKVMDLFCESYGMAPYAKGGMEQMREAFTSIDSFKTVYGNPVIKYEIIDTLDADEFNGVTLQSGKVIKTALVEWMEENLNRYGDGQFIDSKDPDYLKVEEVKAVLLKIEWSYNDKKYGYDKSWWENDDFIKKMDEAQNGRPHDAMPLGKGGAVKLDLTDYDSVINYHDSNVYNLVLYKTEGKWYVYPELLGRLVNPFIDY